MPGPIDTPIADSSKSKRILADVTNEKENIAPVTEDNKKPKFERVFRIPNKGLSFARPASSQPTGLSTSCPSAFHSEMIG
jgi:hypothetical protein